MLSSGEKLLELFAGATREVVIVAPFVKRAALARLLAAIPTKIRTITCVTRWRPEEVAAGVSDLDVFDLLKAQPAARLHIHPLLHAKLFRADDRCLIGSANVTHRALGWVVPANLELMIEAPADSVEVEKFEEQLLSASFEASEQLKSEMAQAAQAIAAAGELPRLLNAEGLDDDDDPTFPADGWLPLCTRPDRLYQIYSGQGVDRLVGWTLEAGRRDIRSLRIPAGLSRVTFYQFVAASLQQAPLIQRIYRAAVNAISLDVGKNLVASSVDEQYRVYSPEEHWNTLRAWLLFFLPHVYRSPSGSNELQRGAKLGELLG